MKVSIEVKKVDGGWIGIVDGWYKTAVQPTPELARHAARIYASQYGR